MAIADSKHSPPTCRGTGSMPHMLQWVRLCHNTQGRRTNTAPLGDRKDIRVQKFALLLRFVHLLWGLLRAGPKVNTPMAGMSLKFLVPVVRMGQLLTCVFQQRFQYGKPSSCRTMLLSSSEPVCPRVQQPRLGELHHPS